MSNQKQYSKEYKDVRAMFWDGKDDNDKNRQYYLEPEGIIYSLGRALKDYTSRTNGKQASDKVASVENMIAALKKETKASQDSFIDRFVAYFNDDPRTTPEAFDVWHHEMCNLFSDSIKEAGIRATVPYGKAQKIVNMTMKTIYCLEGAEEKNRAGYFTYCHMPLDSIILEWFRLYVARDWFNQKKDGRVLLKYSTENGPLPKWSNLDFKEESLSTTFDQYKDGDDLRLKNDKYHYMFFVQVIRKYLAEASQEDNRHKELTSLEAEFYIWQEMQLESAAEALYGLDIGKEQAIRDAKELLGLEWAEEENNTDKQFKQCKRAFKKCSLETKVKYLQTRVKDLCTYFN